MAEHSVLSSSKSYVARRLCSTSGTRFTGWDQYDGGGDRQKRKISPLSSEGDPPFGEAMDSEAKLLTGNPFGQPVSRARTGRKPVDQRMEPAQNQARQMVNPIGARSTSLRGRFQVIASL